MTVTFPEKACAFLQIFTVTKAYLLQLLQLQNHIVALFTVTKAYLLLKRQLKNKK